MNRGYKPTGNETSKNLIPPNEGSSVMKSNKKKKNETIGELIDGLLNDPKVMFLECGNVLKKTREESEKIIDKNKTLEKIIIEKDKKISYLQGKIDAMKDVISELNAARYIELDGTLEEKEANI